VVEVNELLHSHRTVSPKPVHICLDFKDLLPRDLVFRGSFWSCSAKEVFVPFTDINHRLSRYSGELVDLFRLLARLDITEVIDMLPYRSIHSFRSVLRRGCGVEGV
jgi:hypothetical protein